MNHFRGRVLAIHSDCSYAGQWLKQLQVFLDEQGVQPCGHSARDRGILIKVFTSCQSNEVPHQLVYSIRACGNDKNKGTFFVYVRPIVVSEENTQHVQVVNSTYLRCKNKSIDEQCTLNPGYTWHKYDIRNRVHLVRGKDGDRPAWHYVLIVDDQDTIDKFLEKVASGHVDVADYGQVLKSGWGQDPPNDVSQGMLNNYETS